MADHRDVAACRICGSAEFSRFLSLGEMPLANAFVEASDLEQPEPLYPLDVACCESCGLVQLTVVVSPEVMFKQYAYASSASGPAALHFAGLARTLADRFGRSDPLAVEIGSNDGVLLRPLKEVGFRVLGIEPAQNLAALSNAAGLDTWPEFFDERVALRVRRELGPARVVVANNVLAHIDDLHGVLASLDVLLDDDGVFVAEVPYLEELLRRVEYDTIYHEHLSYFALGPLDTLFARGHMEIVDAERIGVHGGSIRIFVTRKGRHPTTARVGELRRHEAASALTSAENLSGFARSVEQSRDTLISLMGGLRDQGHRIAGHGASAKGNTLLNYCGIGPSTIEFVADSTPFKQGRFTPGMHIPVVSEDALYQRAPDYVLLLAWNYAEDILIRHSAYRARGGRFIHPIPRARILG